MDNINNFLNEWTSLINKEDKKDFIYKRELLIEKKCNYNKLFFPIIQRVFASTIALDLVRVQPLSLPTETLFYMVPEFDENFYKREILIEKIYKTKSRRSRRRVSSREG